MIDNNYNMFLLYDIENCQEKNKEVIFMQIIEQLTNDNIFLSKLVENQKNIIDNQSIIIHYKNQLIIEGREKNTKRKK